MKRFFNIFLPLILLFCLLFFRNIWQFKKFLKSNTRPNKILLKVYDYYFHQYGAWIGYKSELSDSVIFPHGFYGIFISNDAVLKDNIVIFQHVTVGSNTVDLHLKNKSFHSPIIESNCYIGAGAKIIGGVSVGENSRIGANAVVYKDVPRNSVVVVSETRIIQQEYDMDNRFYRYQNNNLEVLNNGEYEKVIDK